MKGRVAVTLMIPDTTSKNFSDSGIPYTTNLNTFVITPAVRICSVRVLSQGTSGMSTFSSLRVPIILTPKTMELSPSRINEFKTAFQLILKPFLDSKPIVFFIVTSLLPLCYVVTSLPR